MNLITSSIVMGKSIDYEVKLPTLGDPNDLEQVT